jgi:predicted phage terminase large subunit-like protein
MTEPVNPELVRIREQLLKEHEIRYAMLREKGSKSLYIFNRFILDAEKGDENFSPLGEFHLELCNFIQDRPDKRKLVLIPRSHLKTKIVSIGYSTMKIVNNPKIRILIYSATWQTACDILSAVQKNLQTNQKIIDIWGDMTHDAPVWSQDRIRLKVNDKREPTATAAGISNNLVGGHYDLIIMDDVVNRDNVSTMDQIEKVKTRYRDSLDLLEPHGELIIIGTRWHDSDLYGWIMDPSNQALDNYEVMIKTAYDGNIMTGDNFVPLWPGKFDRKGLLDRLKEEGWAHFSAQYLNNPVPEEDATFKRGWFKYYSSDDIRGSVMNKFLLIDPAISVAKDADYTAMMVVGVDEWNNIFILDITRARMSPNEIIEETFRLRDKWSLTDVGIEQIAFQRVIGYSMRDDVRFKSHPFHITELKPNERTKDQRIKGLQPLYENGKVFHNRALANNIYLEDELVRFPRSSHDDVVDALAYALDVIFPARQKAEKKEGKQRYLYR